MKTNSEKLFHFKNNNIYWTVIINNSWEINGFNVNGHTILYAHCTFLANEVQ